MRAEIWEEHWRHLPGHRHLAVELPAHGNAPDLEAGETLESWSHGLSVVAEREEVRHIVAVSFGALVALVLAARLGSSLCSLILNSPAIPGMAADPQAQGCSLELIRLVRQRGRGPWLTDVWLGWPHAIFAGIRSRPVRWDALRRIIDCHQWSELESGSVSRMVISSSASTMMRRVRANTLLIMGEQDIVVFKRNVQTVLHGIGGARKVRVAGCGHLALLEEPEAMSELVVNHIQRI